MLLRSSLLFRAIPVVLLLLYLAPFALADGLTFGGTPGGMVQFSGSGGVNGAQIPITTVSFGGVTVPITGRNCVGGNSCGFLAFTTGSVVSTSGGQDVFQGGGTLTLTGQLPGGTWATLLTATFAGPVTVTQLTSSTLMMNGSMTISYLNPQLTTLFPGLGNFQGGQASSTFIVHGSIAANGAFAGKASGQTVGLMSAPEPPAMALLGSGLLLAVGFLRRRSKG